MIKSDEKLEKSDEKILLLTIAGVLEAIQKNAMTIDEAEIFLFSPRMINHLRQKKCDENIISLIERGCELEDIESLIPENLHNEIINMIMVHIFLSLPYFQTEKIQNHKKYLNCIKGLAN